ncbi:MAG: division/cell wall cluster transcriptional repressor MraZ [Patescibacteria group bacterium]
MVFFGEYQINFSGSGRLLLPKKVRELLKGNIFILTKGFGSCLSGYDKDDWEKRAAELLNPSLLQPTDMDNRRYIFSSLVYLEIDEQGRFVVPKNLLEYGQLKNKVVIIGVGDHFEIWEAKKWETYKLRIKS